MDTKNIKSKPITFSNNSGIESKQKSGPSKLIFVLLTILLLLAGVFIYKLISDNKELQSTADKLKSSTPAEISKQQESKAKDVVAKLSAILYIEETDTPTIATVVDPEKLKDAANKDFYKNVLKDDLLIVYPKRAIVYRESENKIINIAPIISPEDLQQATASQQSSAPIATPTAATSTSKSTKK
jgi:hypothetical protein